MKIICFDIIQYSLLRNCQAMSVLFNVFWGHKMEYKTPREHVMSDRAEFESRLCHLTSMILVKSFNLLGPLIFLCVCD